MRILILGAAILVGFVATSSLLEDSISGIRSLIDDVSSESLGRIAPRRNLLPREIRPEFPRRHLSSSDSVPSSRNSVLDSLNAVTSLLSGNSGRRDFGDFLPTRRLRGRQFERQNLRHSIPRGIRPQVPRRNLLSPQEPRNDFEIQFPRRNLHNSIIPRGIRSQVPSSRFSGYF